MGVLVSRGDEDNLPKFKPSIKMGKKGDLRSGVSALETAYLPTTISPIYREWF